MIQVAPASLSSWFLDLRANGVTCHEMMKTARRDQVHFLAQRPKHTTASCLVINPQVHKGTSRLHRGDAFHKMAQLPGVLMKSLWSFLVKMSQRCGPKAPSTMFETAGFRGSRLPLSSSLPSSSVWCASFEMGLTALHFRETANAASLGGLGGSFHGEAE